MQSRAATVDEYLAELPADRREAIEAVRRVILANLDGDYEEGMQYGMIGYSVPHRLYAAGYHCDPRQPLPFAALASQKNHMAVYLMSVYGDDAGTRWFQEAWAKSGKRLDMGKSCVRFKRVDDLALDVIGEAIRRMPARKWIETYEAARASSGRPVKKSAVAKKTSAEKTKKPAAVKGAGKRASRKSSAKRAKKL